MYGTQSHVRPAGAPAQRGGIRRWALPAAAALLGAVVFGAAETAEAAMTAVGRSNSKKEATHEQVLEHRFGGDFVKSGNDYSNGSVTVSRVDDSADTSFSSNIKSAQVIASFARKKQTFGVFDASGEFHELVTAKGKNFKAAGSMQDMGAALSAASAAADGGTVTFGRAGGKPEMSSDPTRNQGGRDHLVTYTVSGAGVTGNTMLLFWEDTTGRKSDFDFNDLIVEITAEPLLIPLPAAAWMGLSGLLGMGAVRGLKRLRRRQA